MSIVVLILLAIALLIVLNVFWNLTIALIIPILVWAFTGWLAGRLVQGRGSGIVGDILLGLIGGFVGSIVLGIFGVNLNALPLGGLLTGVVGAAIVIWVSRAIRR